jgi:hypothetical protein
MRGLRLARLGLVALIVVAFQASVMIKITLAGVHPELIWLLPMAAGLVGGMEYGALMGFVAGFALDCLLPTPFGLTAFVGVILGFVVGQIAERTGFGGEGGVWWLLPATGAGVSAGGALAYALFGIVFGQEQFAGVNFIALLPVVALGGALFAVPVWAMSAWAFGSRRGARHGRSSEVSW